MSDIKDIKKHVEILNSEMEGVQKELIRMNAFLKIDVKLTGQMHKAIYGNSNPKGSFTDRMARVETKVWIVLFIVASIITGTVGAFLNNFLRS